MCDRVHGNWAFVGDIKWLVLGYFSVFKPTITPMILELVKDLSNVLSSVVGLNFM